MTQPPALELLLRSVVWGTGATLATAWTQEDNDTFLRTDAVRDDGFIRVHKARATLPGSLLDDSTREHVLAGRLTLWHDQAVDPRGFRGPAYLVTGLPIGRRGTALQVEWAGAVARPVLGRDFDAVLAAASSDSSIADFSIVARVAHELRTPLNAVMGYAQLLELSGTLSSRQSGAIKVIHQSSEHLLELVMQLTEYSRGGAGPLAVINKPVRLLPFLDGIGNIISVSAMHQRIGYVHILPPRLPAEVATDEVRLRQVLINLLANAVKFTDTGEVTLRVSCDCLGERRVRLLFEVKDTGVGMPRADVEKLFVPFQQVGDMTRRRSGLGLGLAISRDIVRAMGSDIDVVSVPGEGSQFSFELELDAGPLVTVPASGHVSIV